MCAVTFKLGRGEQGGAGLQWLSWATMQRPHEATIGTDTFPAARDGLQHMVTGLSSFGSRVKLVQEPSV